MDGLTPWVTETKKGRKMLTSRICKSARGEYPNELDDEKEDKKSAYAIHSEGQALSPYKGADLPLCQDLLWEDYDQKQEPQAQSSSASSKSSSSIALNSWHQFVEDFSISKDDSSLDCSGAPWASQEYYKTGSWVVRKMNPINGFWWNYEASGAALERMVIEAETSFWEIFKVSASSSPNTSTASIVLSSNEEQVEEAGDINYYGSDGKLVEPLPTSSSANEDQLSDQGCVNDRNVDEIPDSTEEIIGPADTYENEKAAEVVPEVEIAAQEHTHTVDLGMVGGQDVTFSKQDREVSLMNEREGPIIRKEQYNPQSATLKEPIEIVVKFSDIIQASCQPKSKLSDLIEQPSSPRLVKHQTRPSPHPPRPRITLADLI